MKHVRALYGYFFGQIGVSPVGGKTHGESIISQEWPVRSGSGFTPEVISMSGSLMEGRCIQNLVI